MAAVAKQLWWPAAPPQPLLHGTRRAGAVVCHYAPWLRRSMQHPPIWGLVLQGPQNVKSRAAQCTAHSRKQAWLECSTRFQCHSYWRLGRRPSGIRAAAALGRLDLAEGGWGGCGWGWPLAPPAHAIAATGASRCRLWLLCVCRGGCGRGMRKWRAGGGPRTSTGCFAGQSFAFVGLSIGLGNRLHCRWLLQTGRFLPRNGVAARRKSACPVEATCGHTCVGLPRVGPARPSAGAPSAARLHEPDYRSLAGTLSEPRRSQQLGRAQRARARQTASAASDRLQGPPLHARNRANNMTAGAGPAVHYSFSQKELKGEVGAGRPIPRRRVLRRGVTDAGGAGSLR
jgi:hypothetical protein